MVYKQVRPRFITVLFCTIFLGIFSQQALARTPSANRECSTCHIMWLNEFKQHETPTLIPFDPKPVVATGKQDVASTERMCFSCHDGFVLDSRFMWQEGKYRHPVGQKPSKDIKIPRIDGKQVFPLNEDGKVYCGTCHSAHGVDWSQKESPVFLRMKNVNSSLCMTCHEERTGGPKHGNHPINKQLDRLPNAMFRAGSKFGKDGRVVCQSCHRPHGAAAKKILVMDNHESNLCRSCHDNKKSIIQTKHNMALSVPDAKNIKGKKASETGPCSVCHIPHDAKGAALWARQKFQTKDPAAAPCMGCHNEKGLAKKKAIKDHSHPTQVAVKKLGISVKDKNWQYQVKPLFNIYQQALPLYNASGQRVKHGGNVSCGSCHDPHVWSSKQRPPDDPDDIVEQEGDGQNSFLRIAQGEISNLCLNCHLDKQTLFYTKHNRDIGFKNKPKAEGRQDGICAECHIAHNGRGPYMQARQPGEGKTPIAKICTACHSKDGLANKKQTGQHSHPLGVNLAKLDTKTDLPLFSPSGERHPQGNVDCATCHNVHQWQPDKRESMAGAMSKVEGNGRNSFLRIMTGRNSKLCVECHTSKKMVINTEHDLRITAAHSTNSLGQATYRSGVCGSCHSVHNAQIDVNLWGRKLPAGQDLKERMCRSCHQQGGPAQAKVPVVFRHPNQILAWATKIRKYISDKFLPRMPVYTTDGHASRMGIITCTSCHNPHRWSPKLKQQPGKNTEGTVINSFLRNASSEHIVCADCHGRDGLYRYKYFHSRNSRRKYLFSE